MIDDLRAVVRELYRRSLQHQVNWLHASATGLETSIDEDFVVNLGDYSVNIWRRPESTDVVIHVLDATGTPVLKDVVDADDPESDVLRELLRLAHRKTSKIDDIFSSLQRALESDGIVGGSVRFPNDDDLPF